MVLDASGDAFTTIALCPGMVLGPRDPKPTSTQIVRAYSKTTVAIAPGGGIPIVDSGLLALAHRRALVAGGSGQRYAVVGPYLSYGELAALVASITGRPRWVVPLPDLARAAGRVEPRTGLGRWCAIGTPTSHLNWQPRAFWACISAATGPMRAWASSIRPARETVASCFPPSQLNQRAKPMNSPRKMRWKPLPGFGAGAHAIFEVGNRGGALDPEHQVEACAAR